MKGLTILHRAHSPKAFVEAKRMAWPALRVGARELSGSAQGSVSASRIALSLCSMSEESWFQETTRKNVQQSLLCPTSWGVDQLHQV